MVIKNIFFNIFFTVGFSLKISTIVIGDHPIRKRNFQILILQFIQIYFTHMQNSIRPLKNRRSKHFPYRYIYVCHTVLKDCFLFRILKLVQPNSQIRSISVLSTDSYTLSLIKSIDQCLLNLLVNACIQRINTDYFIKNRLIIRSDLRHWIGNDREAPLISMNILIGHLAGFAVIQS